MRAERYVKYDVNNYGAHAMCFKIGDYTFFFSYNTLIAVRVCNDLILLDHYFSRTTREHQMAVLRKCRDCNVIKVDLVRFNEIETAMEKMFSFTSDNMKEEVFRR